MWNPPCWGTGSAPLLLDQTKARRPAGFTFWVFQQNERARRILRAARLPSRPAHRRVEYNEEKTPDALYEWKPEEDA